MAQAVVRLPPWKIAISKGRNCGTKNRFAIRGKFIGRQNVWPTTSLHRAHDRWVTIGETWKKIDKGPTSRSLFLRTFPHKKDNTDMSICDLPSEMVTAIAGMCRGCDVEALGATCQSMRAVTRDPPLWRHLFERDFGDLYPVRAGETQWVRHARVHGPWIDAVCSAWRIARPSLLVPPEESWIPAPFARMESAGKDARWLYKVHALTTTVTYVSATVFVGDTMAGKRHGYGASLRSSAWGHAQDWTEGMWADDESVDWCVNVDGYTNGAYLVTSQGRVSEKYRVAYPNGITDFYTLDGSVRQGLVFFLRDTESLRLRDWVSCAAYYVDDALIRDRALCADGSTSEYVFDEDGKRHGRATTWYGNGDRVDHEWVHDKPTRVFGFTFSPSCQEPAFAGRTAIHEEWGWAVVNITPKDKEWVFWPVGDSEGSRLFWRYVERGLIGWHPRLREETLLHRNADAI